MLVKGAATLAAAVNDGGFPDNEASVPSDFEVQE
jgi:hypothetical protein